MKRASVFLWELVFPARSPAQRSTHVDSRRSTFTNLAAALASQPNGPVFGSLRLATKVRETRLAERCNPTRPRDLITVLPFTRMAPDSATVMAQRFGAASLITRSSARLLSTCGQSRPAHRPRIVAQGYGRGLPGVTRVFPRPSRGSFSSVRLSSSVLPAGAQSGDGHRRRLSPLTPYQFVIDRRAFLPRVQLAGRARDTQPVRLFSHIAGVTT